MHIDGTDISVYGARQQNVEMSYGEITNNSEWAEGRSSPLMFSGIAGFKKLKVGVILKGTSRDEIWKNGNRLVTRLMKPSVVKLDGFEHNFCVYLSNVSQVEQSIQRWHKATLELIGYEYGNMVTANGNGTMFEVENKGTLTSPAIVEITPTIGLASVIINGLVRDTVTGDGRPIIIQNLTKNKMISIDGETGLITENGVNKIADVELYDLPSLLPGKNKIVTDEKNIVITIKFKPRYL